MKSTSRVANPVYKKLVVCDFDGTLFRSPIFPYNWPDKPGFGWASKPESLGKTITKPDGSTFNIIPEIPGPEFFIQSTISRIRELSADPSNYIILMTGRPPKVKHRIQELMEIAGLSSIFTSDRIFTVGSPRQKPIEISKLLKHPSFENIETVEAFDDRDLETIKPAILETGLKFIGHQIGPSEYALPQTYQMLVDEKVEEYRKLLEETLENAKKPPVKPDVKVHDKVYYCGVVLDRTSINMLRTQLEEAIIQYIEKHPDAETIMGWSQSQTGESHGLEQLNHHCTSDFKVRPEEEYLLGRKITLTIDGFGVDLNNRVAAWRVSRKDPDFKTMNSPHITALCGKGGRVGLAGKIDSSKYIDISPVNVQGSFELVSDGWVQNRTATLLKRVATRIYR